MALLASLSIAAALAVIFNKRIEETVAVTIFGIISFIYVSGLFTSFIPGLYIAIAFSIAAAVYVVVKVCKNRDDVIGRIITPGLIIYLLLAVYFLFVSHNRIFNNGTDENHHWALVVKYFYMLNDFSNIPGTSDKSVFHCPAVGIWDYFTTKLWISDSLGIMMWGQQLMALSLLLPLTGKIKSFKAYRKITVTTIFMLVVPYCFKYVMGIFVGYTTFQPDYIQYLLIAYGIIAFREYYISNDQYYLWLSFFTLFITVLTKRTGIIAAFVYIFVVFAALILDKERNQKEKWLITLINVVVSAVTFLSWDIYLKICDGNSTEVVEIINSVIAKVAKYGVLAVVVAVCLIAICIFGVIKLQDKHPGMVIGFIVAMFVAVNLFVIKTQMDDTELGKEALLYVIHSLLGKDVYGYTALSLRMDVMQIGYVFPISIGVFLLGAFLIWKYVIEKNAVEKKGKELTGHLVIFLILGYLLLQLFRLMGAVTYMAYKEQANLAVAENYLGPYLIAIIVFIAYLWLEKQETIIDIPGQTAGIIIVIIMLFFNCASIFTNLVDKPVEHHFYALDDWSFSIGDKVFLMDTNIEAYDLGGDFYYQVAPAKSDSGTWYKDGYMGEKYTVSEVSKMLVEGKYNYVYIENLGPDFKDYYADLFENPEELDNNHIYSVEDKGETVKLRLVK